MLDLSTIELRKLIRKLLISTSLIAIVSLAVASKGGGGDKGKANTPLKTNFVPIRTTAGFTLKAGPSFTGSSIVSTEKTPEYVSFQTLITYQRGNIDLYNAPHLQGRIAAYSCTTTPAATSACSIFGSICIKSRRFPSLPLPLK